MMLHKEPQDLVDTTFYESHKYKVRIPWEAYAY